MKFPRLRTHFASHCLGKVKYSKTSALKAAEALKKKRGHLKTIEAYHCEYCDGWHVGHGNPRETLMFGGLKITIGKETHKP
jgi:hypothetical protein